MRPREWIARTLARTDVRASALLGSLLLFAIAIPGLALYAYITTESLEEADRWIAFTLDSVGNAIEAGEDPQRAIDELRAASRDLDVAVRIRDAAGATLAVGGRWPDASHEIEAVMNDDGRSIEQFLAMDPANALIASATLRSGRSVQVALPLSYFAAEAREFGGGLALVGGLAAAAALVLGLAVTLQAFAPLRRATALLRDVDAGKLGRRLPTRGSGDPVDRHAETLNAVLARIDESFNRLRAYSSEVAHELRTPINRIGNVADVALRGSDEAALRPALETIRETTEELSRVIQTLLLLAEVDGRRIEPKRTSIEIDRWLDRTVALYAPSFEEKGVELRVRSDAGAIEGDCTLLDRVLVNLLDNALRHTPTGGAVAIAAERGDAGVAVDVDDSGPGIPRGQRDRIFDRFARLDRRPESPGHGLGLAIALALARLHGGDIRVDRSPLGGARFHWTIPDAPS